jgi:hypothetical protein
VVLEPVGVVEALAVVVDVVEPVAPGGWLVDVVGPEPGCVLGPVDPVEDVVVRAVVVVVEPVAGTTDTGTGTCSAGDDRTTR